MAPSSVSFKCGTRRGREGLVAVRDSGSGFWRGCKELKRFC